MGVKLPGRGPEDAARVAATSANSHSYSHSTHSNHHHSSSTLHPAAPSTQQDPALPGPGPWPAAFHAAFHAHVWCTYRAGFEPIRDLAGLSALPPPLTFPAPLPTSPSPSGAHNSHSHGRGHDAGKSSAHSPSQSDSSAASHSSYMIHGPSGNLFLSGFFLDPEHVKSPILFKTSANQLDKSTSTPSPSSVKAITDQDLRDSMPSYARVGEFLFEVLAKELQASRDSPAFDRYSMAGEIMEVFKLQFEAYTRQYPPFSVRSHTWSKAMQYWRSLADLPESSILAVYINIFLICCVANIISKARGHKSILHPGKFDARGAHCLTFHAYRHQGSRKSRCPYNCRSNQDLSAPAA
ncbi:hypothetical protein B0H10DRAFT_1952480 [Mycena sp. CBHHK59/15]|nr:hypothetical protein B0H10DRAFT_1952480 [Mycena sp. CBHHK59/15]